MVKKKKQGSVTATSLLQEIVDSCPTCKGKGGVRIWRADPGDYVRTPMDPETGQTKYVLKPCPHCGKARKFLKQPALFELDNPSDPAERLALGEIERGLGW